MYIINTTPAVLFSRVFLGPNLSKFKRKWENTI